MKAFRIAASLLLSLMASRALAQAEVAPPNNSQSIQPPIGQSIVIEAKDWLRKPDGEDIAKVWPRQAVRAAQYSGVAMMSCAVGKRGVLESCSIVEERPKDLGFGEATLKLARKFRMPTKTKDGQATKGGRVRIPVIFRRRE